MTIDKFSKTKITLTFVFLYVILFEFTIVNQEVFPKPSLLLESFFALLNDYKLATAFFTTFSFVYLALLGSWIIVELLRLLILKGILKYPGLLLAAAPFKYFSFLFFALVFNLLFPESLTAEFIFLTLFLLIQFFTVISDSVKFLKEEYIVTAKSVKMSENKIFSKIIWKDIEPKVVAKIGKLHISVWTVVIVYEFIGNTNGIGAVFNSVFLYKDLLAIIVLGIIISLTIWIVNLFIHELIEKFIFWK